MPVTGRKPIVGVPMVSALDPELARILNPFVDWSRVVSQRLNEQDQLIEDTGLAPSYPLAAESGIFVYSLVHEREDGTAVLANGATTSRYATGVVTNVNKRRLTVYSTGRWELRALPFTSTQPLLYLSDQNPGFVQDYAPTTALHLRQVVGFKKGVRNTGGIVSAHVSCGEYLKL